MEKIKSLAFDERKIYAINGSLTINEKLTKYYGQEKVENIIFILLASRDDTSK